MVKIEIELKDRDPLYLPIASKTLMYIIGQLRDAGISIENASITTFTGSTNVFIKDGKEYFSSEENEEEEV